jgi:hypothetical protein
MEWVDSNPIPWNSMDYFLAGNPAMFSFHTQYGFHGISNEFILQIHIIFHKDSMVTFHMDSME